jgi:hypothetical protein
VKQGDRVYTARTLTGAYADYALEAGHIWRELQEINPKYSFTEHLGRQPFRQEDVERIAEGLAKAGLLNEQIATLAH